MSDDEFTVAVSGGKKRVSARLYRPGDGAPAWLVLAPGAGAGHDHPFMVTFGRALAARGLHLVTFNFPYIEDGRRVPDPNGVLEDCWVSVLEAVRKKAGSAPVFAGGKSMGGRIASQVAAQLQAESGVRGLVFLGYPLHPPGKSESRRTAHWPRIHLPALFVQGAGDPFGSPDELETELPRYRGQTRVLVVEEGDHSFKVPRRSGRSQDAVYTQIQDAVAAWIHDVLIGASA